MKFFKMNSIKDFLFYFFLLAGIYITIGTLVIYAFANYALPLFVNVPEVSIGISLIIFLTMVFISSFFFRR